MTTKRPNGKWRGRFRDANGKEHAKDFALKKDAAAWERGQRADADRGVGLDVARGRKITVQQFAESWRAVQPHRESTSRSVENVLRTRIYPTIGGRALASLRPSDVAALQRGLAQRYAPNTVSQTMGVLTHLLKAAVADRVIAINPADAVKPIPVPRASYVIPTTEQVFALYEAFPPELAVFVALGAGCGLRPSESLGVAAGDVDFLHRSLSVARQLNGKTYKLTEVKTASSERTVPVPDWTLEALSSHLARFGSGDETVMYRLGRSRRPAAHSTVNGAWARARAAVGADPRLRPHDLRHYAASLLITAGIPVTDVAAYLGHASPAITLGTYAHLWPDSETRVRATLNEKLSAARADILRTSGAVEGR